MPSIDSRKHSLIAAIVAEARKRAKNRDPALVDSFVRAFYANVSAEELSERKADALAGAALSNLASIARRRVGETTIRVHNQIGRASCRERV